MPDIVLPGYLNDADLIARVEQPAVFLSVRQVDAPQHIALSGLVIIAQRSQSLADGVQPVVDGIQCPLGDAVGL